MRQKWMLVTPVMAAQWLSKMARNRNLSRTFVKQLVEDILSGQFTASHQGIAFNTKGELIDGQHRLTAIVEANRSVNLLVFFDIPDEAMLNIDTGRKRTDIEALQIAGYEWSKDDVTVARRMMIGGRHDSWFRITNKAILIDFLREYETQIQQACAMMNAAIVRHASARAVVARALVTQDPDRIERFCKIVSTGDATLPDDITARKFRDWLLQSSGRLHGGTGRSECYQKCQTALRAHLRHESLTRIVGSKVEHFMIPWDSREQDDGATNTLEMAGATA